MWGEKAGCNLVHQQSVPVLFYNTVQASWLACSHGSDVQISCSACSCGSGVQVLCLAPLESEYSHVNAEQKVETKTQ